MSFHLALPLPLQYNKLALLVGSQELHSTVYFLTLGQLSYARPHPHMHFCPLDSYRDT